jgi:RNA polymerase sigma-70 factor (ECF subfamily)
MSRVDGTSRGTSLAGRAKAGDSAALERLLAELAPSIVRSVRLIVGSGSPVAEDAAQEALVDVARGIGSLGDPAAVRVWAARIATRRAIKVARRERLVRLAPASSAAGATHAEPHEATTAALKEAFDELPPRLRATAVLRLHLGLSEAESAEALGCSVGTVKSNLHDARRRLAEALRDRGATPMVIEKVKESRP